MMKLKVKYNDLFVKVTLDLFVKVTEADKEKTVLSSRYLHTYYM